MQFSGKPFVRLIIFFLAGILTTQLVPSSKEINTGLMIFLFVLFVITGFVLQVKQIPYSYRWLPGLTLALCIFWSGFSLSIIQNTHTHRILRQASHHSWIGRLTTEPLIRNKNYKAEIKLTACADSNYSLTPALKAILYIPSNSQSGRLHTGDRLIFKGNFTKPTPPQNPDAFDYRHYLNIRGIDYVIFTSKNRWKKLPVNQDFSLIHLFEHLRLDLLQVLKNNGLSGQQYAVASAILLGNDELIDPEIRLNYAGAGAVHILCVSGMHVGIIFLLFSQLLFFLNKIKYGQIIKSILLVIIIWSYALLTGLSPSVSRAATMISMFIAAENLQRPYAPYNILAASAFLLLIFQPMLIFNVGFQLSFAAVLGIIALYPPLFHLFYFRIRLIRYLWAAFAVSFSAQIGAFPVAAHYFHLFPNYFLLTNLAVFGLAYLILSTGICLLSLAWIPPLAKTLGTFLGSQVFLLNKIVVSISQLPGAVQNQLYFPWPKVFLVYLLILLLYMMIMKKNIRYLLAVLGSSIVLFSYQTVLKAKHLQQNRVIIYAIRGHTAVDFIRGLQDILLVDSSLFTQPRLLDLSIKNYHIRHGLITSLAKLNSTINKPWIQYQCGLTNYGHQQFFILDLKQQYFPDLKRKIKINSLIYRGNRFISLFEIMKSFQFKQVILDGSTSNWVNRKIIAECKMLNIRYFNLRNKGAFVFKE